MIFSWGWYRLSCWSMDCECRLDGVVNFKTEIRKCAWRESVFHRYAETEKRNLRGRYDLFVSWRYNRNFRNTEFFNLITFFPFWFLSFYLAPLLACVCAFFRHVLRSSSLWFSYLFHIGELLLSLLQNLLDVNRKLPSIKFRGKTIICAFNKSCL